MKKPPKVCINIVHVNGEEILNNCLKSIYETNYSNLQVNVLLNSTKDNSEKIAKKYKCRIFKSKKNLGFAGGHNFLEKKSEGEYIAIVNNDIETEKDWLKHLVDFAVKNRVEICQPKIKWLRNKDYFEAAGACGGFIDKYGYQFYRGRIFDNIEKDKGQYEKAKRIFWACGSSVLIKKSLVKKIGLFDEDFFMYSEELDFCWRANISGAKIFSVPKSVVYHLGSYSINSMKLSSEKEYLLHRNTLLTFLKNYSGKNIRRYSFQRIILEIISGLAIPKKFIPTTKSLTWVVKNRKKIREKRERTQKLRKVGDESYSENILKKPVTYLYFIKGKKTFQEIEKYF